MARTRQKIGKILRQWGVINDHQLKEALEAAKASGQRTGEALVDLGYAAETDIAKALASQFDMEYIDLDQPNAIDRNKLDLIPTDVVKKYLVLPPG